MGSSQIYINVPLATTRSIRVLKLQRRSENPEKLSCELKTVSLDDKPPCKFVALSYCWGDPVLNHTIQCNESSVLITRNCHAALQALGKGHNDTMFWIDSICIDQTNTSERNHQISLIAEIYKRADKVYIWLGEWDESLQKAVEILKGIVAPLTRKTSFPDQALDTAKGLLKGASRSICTRRGSHTVDLGNEDGMNSSWRVQTAMHERATALKNVVKSATDDPLSPFFRTAWFSRLWTSAEVSMASGENVIFYGGSEHKGFLTWTELMGAVSVLRSVGYDWADVSIVTALQSHLFKQLLKERFPYVKKLCSGKLNAKGPPASLQDILALARQKNSFNPKDKVFALYGVLTELGIQATPPDYSKTIDEIYRDVTIDAINHDQSLRILYQAPSDHRSIHPTLPSWVPDWSDHGWSLTSSDNSRSELASQTYFHASGSAPACWSFFTDKTQLRLKGKFLDTIVTTSEPFFVDIDGLQSYKLSSSSTQGGPQSWNRSQAHNAAEAFSILRSWTDISRWYPSYPTEEDPTIAFCHTLLHSHSEPGKKLHSAFHPWYNYMTLSPHEFLTQHLPSSFHSGDNISQLSWYRATYGNNPQREIDTRAFREPQGIFHETVIRRVNRKTFFTTEKGYFGISPAVVERDDAVVVVRSDRAENLIMPGDKIAVVAGLGLPVVLRRMVREDNDSEKADESGEESDGWDEKGKGYQEGDKDGRELYRLVTHVYVHGIMDGEGWIDERIPVEDIVLV